MTARLPRPLPKPAESSSDSTASESTGVTELVLDEHNEDVLLSLLTYTYNLLKSQEHEIPNKDQLLYKVCLLIISEMYFANLIRFLISGRRKHCLLCFCRSSFWRRSKSLHQYWRQSWRSAFQKRCERIVCSYCSLFLMISLKNEHRFVSSSILKSICTSQSIT